MSSYPVLGNKSLSKFDVLVIGSGPSGTAVTAMLCRHGQKVLVLEAGRNYFDGLDDPAAGRPTPRYSNDELKMRHRWFIHRDPLVDPRTFRKSTADGDRLWSGSFTDLTVNVGGGGVHADLKAPRFVPTDFKLGTLLGPIPGAAFADWPVDYDMLERFYLDTERQMGVQGLAGHPLDPPRSGPYPMPPGAPMYIAERIKVGAAKLGYLVHPSATAVNSRPYDGRPACVDCGFCSGHVCPVNAKGAHAVGMLRKALLSGNCQLLPETRAVKLLTNGAGTAIMGVEATLPDGKRGMFTADRYVLAANPIEDVRLLHLSGGGAPLGNGSGQVGRNLMVHYGTDVLGIFEDQLHAHRGRSSTHAISEMRGVPGDPSRPLGGIVQITTTTYQISEALVVKDRFRAIGVEGALYRKLLRQGRARDRIIALSMYGEDAPQPKNTVDLDPAVRDLDGVPAARITYDSHEFETSASDFYVPKMIEILGASGAKFAAKGQSGGGGHLMGTLRFGSDPKTSVCDASGRFHDIGNLYGSGGSLFPTSSGFNPTLTIMALSERVAAEMVFPGSPEQALDGA